MRNLHYALVLCVTTGLFAHQAAIAGDLEEGKKLYDGKDYARARPVLEKAAQFSPMNWQTHYYLANTNLALGRMAAAKYEYELCIRSTSNAALQAKCREGISRADKHSSQVRAAAPSSGSNSSSDSKSDDVKLTDAQIAANRRKDEIMKHAREAVAKVKQETKDQMEHERANANEFWQYPDGRIGTDLSEDRKEEIHTAAEEKCRKIMREAEAKARSITGH
jgi:thioredoxin-like negative regulator of GroEL